MTSSPHSKSNTERNLRAIITSEAVANLRCNAYAQYAIQEGYTEVAQIFHEAAISDTVQGLKHLRLSGDMGSTAENLRAIIEVKTQEAAAYSRMITEAMEDGDQEAANAINLVMERERQRLASLTEALTGLESKSATEAPAHGEVVFEQEMYEAAVKEVETERARIIRKERLREVVFGAEDGLISMVALVTSLAVAVESQTTILIAGMAAAVPGMISMSTGAFLGSRTERDVERAEIERETRELEENPSQKLAELVVLLRKDGMAFEDARHVADEIAQDRIPLLRTLLEKELGISNDIAPNPLKDALVMGASFLVGAAIPLFPHMIATGETAIAVSVGATLIGLFLLGMYKGWIVERSPVLQGLEILGIGTLSAAVGYVLGEFIPRLFS